MPTCFSLHRSLVIIQQVIDEDSRPRGSWFLIFLDVGTVALTGLGALVPCQSLTVNCADSSSLIGGLPRKPELLPISCKVLHLGECKSRCCPSLQAVLRFIAAGRGILLSELPSRSGELDESLI
jgi:hypothetical protein